MSVCHPRVAARAAVARHTNDAALAVRLDVAASPASGETLLAS